MQNTAKPIDLIVWNPYPFEAMSSKGLPIDKVIDIDIGDGDGAGGGKKPDTLPWWWTR